MSKKVMISQPMRGFSEEHIKKEREKAVVILEKNGYEVVNSYFKDEPEAKNKPIAYLSESIKVMSECDAVYFCKGWEKARGCGIEFFVAKDYGLGILFERGFDKE